MSRSRRLSIIPGLLGLLVVAIFLVGSGSGRAAAAAAFTDCGSAVGARWQQGRDSGVKWHVLATPNFRCVGARGWVADLSARSASTGTVDTVRFAGGSGWSCFAGRSLLLGMCVSRDPAGGSDRVVIVLGASPANQFLFDGFKAGSASATSALTGLLGSGGSGSGLTVTALRGRTGRAPAVCTTIAGPGWRIVPQSGSTWRVYAGGGLKCLAAQGWVADLGARLATHRGGAPLEFDGGDGWRCVVGTQNAYVGTCGRPRSAREPGGDLELKYVTVVPAGVQEALVARVASNGFDAAVRTLFYPVSAEGAFRRCGGWKGASWRAGGVTSDRWLYGVAGGYPCRPTIGFLSTLATWAKNDTGTRNVGVAGDWQCRSTAASLQTVCTWNGPPPASDRREHAPLRVAIVADRAGAATELARLLGG
jgi:hypothetical protein